MGIYIALQKESGATIDSIADDKNLLHRLLPRGDSRLLSGIDWYGDTIFNRVQMGQFLKEWRAMQNPAATPEEQLLLATVERLALACEAGTHLYLKFIGD